MNFEDNIFKKSNINIDKLLTYGFYKDNNKYVYKVIIDKTNLELIVIYDNKISIKVMDNDFDCEYINFRIENITGEFNSYVKEKIEEILIDIRNNCCSSNSFINPQSNRIAKYIFNTYGIVPEFVFSDNPDIGVFKKNHKKWFGIIMYISYKKIDDKLDDKMVEVINVKIDEDNLSKYLEIDGIYVSYHMNKKKWISIVLDDTIDDVILESFIDQSYNLVK